MSTVRGLVKVDPQTDQNYDILGDRYFTDVAIAEGQLWVLPTESNDVFRLDPASGHIDHVAAVDGACLLDASNEGVFVASCRIGDGSELAKNSLSRIDPTTGEVTWTIPIRGYGTLAVAGGQVLAAQRDASSWAGEIHLYRVDALTGETSEPPQVIVSGGHRTQAEGITGGFAAVGAGSLWLADPYSGEVLRVGLSA